MCSRNACSRCISFTYLSIFPPCIFPLQRERAQAAGGMVGCGGRVRRSYLSSCGSCFFFCLGVFLLAFTYLGSLHVMPCFFFFSVSSSIIYLFVVSCVFPL